MSFQNTGPYPSGTAVVPGDATPLPPTRALYVGVSGDIAVDFYTSGTNIILKAVPVGIHSFEVVKIYATGTTATNIIALR